MAAWFLVGGWWVHRENTVCGIGGAAVFEDGRPGGRGGGAAEGARGAGPRGGGGVAAVPGNEGDGSGDAELDDSDGRDAAAFSGDCGWHDVEWGALFLRGRSGVFRPRRFIWWEHRRLSGQPGAVCGVLPGGD